MAGKKKQIKTGPEGAKVKLGDLPVKGGPKGGGTHHVDGTHHVAGTHHLAGEHHIETSGR